MRLILVRHGDAFAGFHGPIAGPVGCAGLTSLGRCQAEALRDHLASSGRVHADVLVSSILPRAIQTAEIIAPGLGLELSIRDCDLCEVHTGEADGVDWTEYNACYGSYDMEAEPDRAFAPGGDSWNSFHARVRRTMHRLAREHEGQTVVAACHAGFIIASLRLQLGILDPATSAHLRPSNTGLTEWSYEPTGARWQLESYNEAVHLLMMDAGQEFSVDDARAAAARDDLGEWVRRFLASPGSDNAALGHALTHAERWWLGPLRLPIDQLHRLAGPPGAPVLQPVSEDEWRDDVDELAHHVERGMEPAPVIVSYRVDQLMLEDGNHRVEAIRRAGGTAAWAIVGFDDEASRDAFVLQAAQRRRQ